MFLCAPTLTLRFVVGRRRLTVTSPSSESFPIFDVFFCLIYDSRTVIWESCFKGGKKEESLSVSFSPVDLIVYEYTSCLFACLFPSSHAIKIFKKEQINNFEPLSPPFSSPFFYSKEDKKSRLKNNIITK